MAAQPSALTVQMLEAPPLPLLLRMASPNAMAFLVQAAVGMAEVAFVGQLGTVPLAALALMFPGLMLMQMLANGAIGGAVSSAVARAMGAADRVRAETLIWHAVVIAVCAGAGFCLLYLGIGRQLVDALGPGEAVAAAAAEYAVIVFGASAVLWLAALLSAVFRGMGNMRTSGWPDDRRGSGAGAAGGHPDPWPVRSAEPGCARRSAGGGGGRRRRQCHSARPPGRRPRRPAVGLCPIRARVSELPGRRPGSLSPFSVLPSADHVWSASAAALPASASSRVWNFAIPGSAWALP
ncbi:MAG: MATE family efflux transporter [Gammaproteobacteria bacterium]|nr:MATE family efflux transporter [Gammaproteobacteria bacterium]